MKIRRLLILCFIISFILISCRQTTEENAGDLSATNMTEPAFNEESTAQETGVETVSEDFSEAISVTMASAEAPTTHMEEVPEYLAGIADAVYLNPFSPSEWQVWDEELGFKLCSLYIDGEKHRALYREDGLVIIESVITTENRVSTSGYGTHYDYRVRYGENEQCVSMNESLSLLHIIFADMDDDGDDELLFYTWQRDVDGYGSCLYIMRFPTLELVEIDYSEEFLNSVIVDYGISSVEIEDGRSAAVVTFYICDNMGNRYEGSTNLFNPSASGDSGFSYDWDYEMELFGNTGIFPVYESGGLTKTIMGHSTFCISARYDRRYRYVYLSVYAVISYNALEGRYETEELILSCRSDDGEQPSEIVIPVK